MVRPDELGSELGALGTVVAAAYTINRLLRLAPIQARNPFRLDPETLKTLKHGVGLAGRAGRRAERAGHGGGGGVHHQPPAAPGPDPGSPPLSPTDPCKPSWLQESKLLLTVSCVDKWCA